MPASIRDPQPLVHLPGSLTPRLTHSDNGKALVEKCFELWNSGQQDRLRGYFAASFVGHSMPDGKESRSFAEWMTTLQPTDAPIHMFVDAVLDERSLISVVGRTREFSDDGVVMHDVVWRFRVGQLIEEMWVYRNLDVVEE